MKTIKEIIENSQISEQEYETIKKRFARIVHDFMRDTRTGYINHDQWDDLFNALYQEENEIMQYLTKQELMFINQEWQEEYEQKDIRL